MPGTIEHLSGQFNRGYTKAIQDIIDEFCNVQGDLQRHKKRFNFKLIVQLLQLFLKHRENFREDWGGFIRWNTQKETLEFYKT